MRIKSKHSRSYSPKSSLQLVLLSDTHELHREVDVPPGDILIHAGDFTMFSRSLPAIIDFNDWLAELPHRYKIVVPGNHETFLHTDPSNRALVSNAAVLINEGIEIAGLRIWGSPVTHGSGPAFPMASTEDRQKLYARVPKDTEILITHGPPYGILDLIPGSEIHAGDPELLRAVTRIKPKLHVFGHVHSAHGIFDTEHTMFANACLLGPNGDIDSEPTVLRIARR